MFEREAVGADEQFVVTQRVASNGIEAFLVDRQAFGSGVLVFRVLTELLLEIANQLDRAVATFWRSRP